MGVGEEPDERGRVAVRSKFLVVFTRESHESKRWFGGDYLDVVVRSGDGWRFAEKACFGRWLLAPELAGDVTGRRRAF
jgi:3-phenylpropionate/cinnamic acid dioxygenase small subunit